MADPATNKMRDFAERLLAQEAAAGKPSEANVAAAFRVCEKLGRPLTTLAGAEGFRSLLLRALTLAKREAPSLSALQVNAAGSLEGLSDAEHHQNKQDAEAGVLLVEQLIGLIFTFIGEDLTLRLTHGVWPDTSFNTTDDGRYEEA